MDYKTYSRKARQLARKNYQGDIPDHMDVDHIFSCKHAYALAIPLDVLSHCANLRLIPKAENRSKGERSDINLVELDMITGWGEGEENAGS